jgi:Protein of unknown function (DUF3306)
MSEEKEAFLERWSRLKQEQPAEKPSVPAAKEEPLPPLQAVEDLKPDSDFTPFMNPKVDDATRRSALKKLFTDPHFNVVDPFEAYSEDYTKSDPIPEKMLKAINRARDLAVDGPEKVAEKERLAEQADQAEQAEKVEKAEVPKQEAEDVPGKQDA